MEGRSQELEPTCDEEKLLLDAAAAADEHVTASVHGAAYIVAALKSPARCAKSSAQSLRKFASEMVGATAEV